MLLRGGTYLVTGASGGIGRAVATMIAKNGGRVIIVGRRMKELAITRATASFPQSPDHRVVTCDLREYDRVSTLVHDMNDGEKLDGMVHCAGVEVVRPLKGTPTPTLAAQQQLIVEVFHRLTAGIRWVSNASLVGISSVAAHRSAGYLTAYASARGALEAYIRAAAIELAPIRVNAIICGAVETQMHERLIGVMQKETAEGYRRAHPLGFGKPEDVAAAACFLLSPAARWITGTGLVCDGGFLAR